MVRRRDGHTRGTDFHGGPCHRNCGSSESRKVIIMWAHVREARARLCAHALVRAFELRHPADLQRRPARLFFLVEKALNARLARERCAQGFPTDHRKIPVFFFLMVTATQEGHEGNRMDTERRD